MNNEIKMRVEGRVLLFQFKVIVHAFALKMCTRKTQSCKKIKNSLIFFTFLN